MKKGFEDLLSLYFIEGDITMTEFRSYYRTEFMKLMTGFYEWSQKNQDVIKDRGIWFAAHKYLMKIDRKEAYDLRKKLAEIKAKKSESPVSNTSHP